MNPHTVLLDGARPRPPSSPAACVVFGWRAMLKIKHVPEQLFDVTLMPIITMLMFTYLFGGALAGSPGQYLQYVLPGVMAMGVVMTTMYTGTALNIDVTKGIFDRFRSLPIWRPAALVGALLGDVVRYALACAVMIALGLALGYRPGGGALAVLTSVGLLLLFSFSLSWVWTTLGLVVRSDKAVQGIGMMVIMPLVFLSSVFVRPDTMPGLVRTLVELNPITHLVDAMRGVLDGNPDTGRIGLVLVTCAVLVLVFGFLTMRQYNRR